MLTDVEIRNLFSDAADFTARELLCGRHKLYVYCIDGLVSGSDMSDFVIKPAMQELKGDTMKILYRNALHGMVYNSVALPCETLDDIQSRLVNGFCILLFPSVGALAFEVKTGEKRSISQPDMENTAKGAKDSFTETIRTNTSLIRRHLRSTALCIREMQIGNKSMTNVAVVWINGVTPVEYVNRILVRLVNLSTRDFLSPASVEETVTGGRKTSFPLLQYTQRTDRFCRGLLSGRVGIFVDGLPLGYLLPVDVGYLMDSAEDMSRGYVVASAVRILRYFALIIDLLLPAIYVALVVHHWNWLPPSFMQVILQGRSGVPISPAWEILGLLVAFELLQESGIHLPQSFGQSVSIIGGIVVGTAGVDAGLISSTALVTVSLAGVCGFVLPNRDFADGIRLWRLGLAAVSAVLGLWGVVIGTILLVMHLLTLKSLGVPYLRFFEPGLLRKRVKKENGKKS